MALSGLFKTWKRNQEQRENIRYKWSQNLDKDLLTFLFWFEFNFIISSLQLHSLLLLFPSPVVFEVPLKPRSFQPVFNPFDFTHTQTNLNYCYFFFLYKKGYERPAWSLYYKSQSSCPQTSYIVCLYLKYHRKGKLFSAQHIGGAIDRVYQNSRNWRGF